MRTFEDVHPELMPTIIKTWGSIDGLKKYSDWDCGELKEMWERNADGVLVDVTARELARQELERAKEAMEMLRLNMAKEG